MTARILSLARAASGAGEEESRLLEELCLAAELYWKSRLREGIAAEDCASAFSCAAAFTAAAELTAGKSSGVPASFTAGAVSIRERGAAETAALAAELRSAAEHLMAPYAREEGFAFRGVRG